jgi:hypothetical protein
MCTTVAECKTVMIAVLTVMSGMDPHMISQDTGWIENDSVWDDLIRVGHSETLWHDEG